MMNCISPARFDEIAEIALDATLTPFQRETLMNDANELETLNSLIPNEY